MDSSNDVEAMNDAAQAVVHGKPDYFLHVPVGKVWRLDD
jgi:hypothetical protein